MLTAATTLACFTACAAGPGQVAPEAHPKAASNDDAPVVAGYGVGTFAVGELLYETDFSDAEQWTLQIQPKPDSDLKPRVSMDNGMLDVYAPERGCTAWLNDPFEGPIVITYQVRCPAGNAEGPRHPGPRHQQLLARVRPHPHRGDF